MSEIGLIDTWDGRRVSLERVERERVLMNTNTLTFELQYNACSMRTNSEDIVLTVESSLVPFFRSNSTKR